MVDLRSDTVTKPTRAMREAMATAEVGDDVFGEDPSINELQSYIAELFGKEGALYVPSGTMANQVSIKAHTEPGDEVICERGCHIFNYECGSPALLSGVQLYPIDGDHGIITADQVQNAIRPENVHHPVTRVISLENTHNRAGGVIYPLETIREISEVARKYNLKMHLDGARLMNAVVETGIEPKEYGQFFDSMTLCFSKGLGAPVGSIVAGKSEFIQNAHRFRKAYGGGMRQAGIIAAGAFFAMKNHVQRLEEDHKNAKKLAAGFAQCTEISIELEWVHTNIIIFEVNHPVLTAQSFCNEMGKRNVHMLSITDTRVRAVTNFMVDESDIDSAIKQCKDVFEQAA